MASIGVLSACTELVVYQPVIAVVLVYKLADGASGLYSLGSTLFWFCGCALRGACDGASYAYCKVAG